MNEMLVAVFDTEEGAGKGLEALQQLHQEGGVSLYGWALIVKGLDGTISIRRQSGESLAGTGLGLLMGAIIGILGGPAGVAVGGTIGSYIGLLADCAQHGINLQFLDDVSKTLSVGKAAVLAEIEESWVSPIEQRLKQQDGTVFRHFRTEMIDDQLLQEEAALQQALEKRIAELDKANAADREAIRAQMVDIRQQLKSLQDRARAAIDLKKAETDLRMRALRAQAETAAKEARARIESRISETHADFEQRVHKLNQAWALAKQALGPEVDSSTRA